MKDFLNYKKDQLGLITIKTSLTVSSIVLLATVSSSFLIVPAASSIGDRNGMCITATLENDPSFFSQRGGCEIAPPTITPTVEPTEPPVEPTTPPQVTSPAVPPATPPPVNNSTELTFEAQNQPLRSIAASADGKLMVGVSSNTNRVISTADSGKTWSDKLSVFGGQQLVGIGVSADGTKMITAGLVSVNSGANPGSVWVSTNSGSSWRAALTSKKDNFGVGSYKNPAISRDGKAMIASDDRNSRTDISFDSGATWKSIGKYLLLNAMSSDGKTIIGGANTSTIWIQVDGGAFTLLPPIDAVKTNITSYSMSADGKTILVSSSTGKVYISKDTGATWIEKTEFSSTYINKVALSDDGSKMAVANSGIYISTDSGTTWSLSNAPLNGFGSLQFSPDGSKLYAAETATNASGWWIGSFGP